MNCTVLTGNGWGEHLFKGQVETEETENGNGKLKRKTEAEIGNGKAEIGKWSSTFIALMASFAHARSIWGLRNGIA